MRNQLIQVVMVGDCAWVGDTLVHYAPPCIRYKHLTRTRSIYSKTVGISLKILSSAGDVYHVHYGLQDHFITKLLKHKPTICHLHGSDLRNAMNGPYRWIVMSNLRTADKIIVAVPDILLVAKSYRKDAVYIPNPVNLDIFKPAPLREHGRELRVLFASNLSFVKGAYQFVEQFAAHQRTNPDSILHIIRYGENQSEIIGLLSRQGVRYKVHEPLPHDQMAILYHSADVVVTDFKLGYLHMTSLEAMASNRPVLQYINEKLYFNVKMPLPPVMRIDKIDKLDKGIQMLADESVREKTCNEQLAYVRKYHNPTEISKKMADFYHEVISNS
jgi:glycosyltransferase involved in cell wall biosynthesis